MNELYSPSVIINEIKMLTMQNNSGFKPVIAVVGFGKMGILHSGILNLLIPDSVRCIVDKSFLISYCGKLLVKKINFYKTLEKLISNEDVDAVYVTTPTSSHYTLVRRALEAGIKGIFVEKPPTINSKQLLELVDLAGNSTVMVGFQKRFALPFMHVKRILDSKALGSVKHVTGYIRSGDILTSTSRFDKLGRGVLLDLGTHLADLMTWFFGELNVTKVRFRSLYTKVDDTVEAELYSPEGFRILFEASWSNPDYRLPETYIKIKLEKGTIEVTEDYLRISENDGFGKTYYKPNYYQGFPPVNLADPEYTIEDMHFLASLANGTKTMTELPDIQRSMELVDRLYESG